LRRVFLCQHAGRRWTWRVGQLLYPTIQILTWVRFPTPVADFFCLLHQEHCNTINAETGG
jgi:hypothetical protein